jgi:predicted nucleotidyltransferase
MLPKTEILSKLREHSQELKALGVKRVGLFGSFAESRQSHRSDIDILVEFYRGRKTFDSYMELKFFLEKLLRRRVDLVISEALKARIKSHVLSQVEYA